MRSLVCIEQQSPRRPCDIYICTCGWWNIVKARMLHWLFEVNLSVCKHSTLTHSQPGTHYINYGHKIGYGNIQLGLV